MNRSLIVPVVLVAAAGAILWRLSVRIPEAIQIGGKGLILRNGDCREAIPIASIEKERRRADVMDIDRTVIELYDGSRIVDEKIDLPAQYHINVPPNALLREIFHKEGFKNVADNGKIAIYRSIDEANESLDILVVYKGKHDLELVYPLKGGIEEIFVRCLIEGKKKRGPDIVNNVVEGDTKPLPEPDWSEKLFTLRYIVNKDM